MSMSQIADHATHASSADAREAVLSWLADVRALEKPRLVWLSLFAGGLLTLIGIRFMIVPESAAFTFGVGVDQPGTELHHIIGVRDIWLGGLAVLFAILREWRALAAWFILAAGVCFYDAGIVFTTTAHAWAIAFHCGSGVFCALVGRGCLRTRKA